MRTPDHVWRCKFWRYIQSPAGARERMSMRLDANTGRWHWNAGGHTSEGFTEQVPCRMDAEMTMKKLGWIV